MANGILTKGVELRIGETAGSTTTYTAIPGLFEFPDLGATPDMVDITTLADGNMNYIPGIKDYGSLDFSFIWDGAATSSNFDTCKALENAVQKWEVAIPTSTAATYKKFHFEGQPSVHMTGAGVNARIEFVVSIALNSDISIAA